MLGSVDLIFKTDINWSAFLNSFENLQLQYKAQLIKIQSIEVLPQKRFLVRINTFSDLNINAFKKHFWQKYNRSLVALSDNNKMTIGQNINNEEIKVYKQN